MGAGRLRGPDGVAGAGRVRDVLLLGFARGLAFGPVWGGLLSTVSGALAAAVSFGIARAVGRTLVEALVGGRNLGAADRWFARCGAYVVLVARLIPVVSFDVISYAAGLTRMKLWSFILDTTAGMTPACFVCACLGDRMPRNVNLFLAAFGVFVVGVVMAAIIQHRRRGESV